MSESSNEQDVIREVLRGAPSWITVEAVQDTLRTFRPFYGSGMTPTDALEILLNMGNLFELLDEKARSLVTGAALIAPRVEPTPFG